MYQHYIVDHKNFLGNSSAYLHIENHEKLIVFYPIPKNANTSIEFFLMKHLNIEVSEKDFSSLPRHELIKNIDLEKKHSRIVSFAPSKQLFAEIPSTTPDGKPVEKFCIIRDPVERFISAYKNRVLFHQDANVKGMSIDKIIENLKNKKIDNFHFIPQNLIIGDNPSYFQYVFHITKLSEAEDYINDFFKKKLKLLRLQTGGNNFELELNSQQIESIKEIYKYDYEFISKVKLK